MFLSEWDGLNSSSSSSSTDATSSGGGLGEKKQPQAPVLVLGATNRPMDLDKAFLRRMPVQIQTRVPSLSGRVAILAAQLSREKLDLDVDLEELAIRTEGYTGSDIRELVRVASLQRVKSYVVTARQAINLTSDATATSSSSGSDGHKATLHTRPLSREDFEYALGKTSSSCECAHTHCSLSVFFLIVVYLFICLQARRPRITAHSYM